MLQVPPQPARPSGGLITLSRESPSPGPPHQVNQGGAVRHAAVRDAQRRHLTAVRRGRWPRFPAPAPTTPELVAAVERAIDARGGLAQDEAPVFYAPQTLQISPGGTGVDSLQVFQSVNGTLWLAVIAGGVSPADLLTPGSSPLDGAPLSVGLWLTGQYPAMAR